MFYSGWEFPNPQRMMCSSEQQDGGYFVQDTYSPGISLVHFLPPNMIRARTSTAGSPRSRAGGRIHVKGNAPIHPNSGIFYFEVEVRSVAGGDKNDAGVGTGEVGLVVGICRASLPPGALPGEEAGSIGLFTAQRMVYLNGRGEGESVRFPSGAYGRNSVGVRRDDAGEQEERRFKGVQLGDTVGCVVNLLEGTVQFTFNGRLIDFVHTLNSRGMKQGYYPAVGVFRRLPAVSLRVVFQSAGRSMTAPRSPNTPAAAERRTGGLGTTNGVLRGRDASVRVSGDFLFDIDKYCASVAERVVQLHHLRVDANSPRCETDGNSCSCHDAKITSVIRRHLAARGMTKALSAFDREQEQLGCLCTSQAGRGDDNKAMGADEHAQEERMSSERTPYEKDGFTLPDANTSEENKSPALVYCSHIQRLREAILHGDTLSALQRILASNLLSPDMMEKLSDAVPGANSLSPEFYGLLFFAQRRDILFLLRMTHLVEFTFGIMEQNLGSLLAHTGSGKHGGGDSSTAIYSGEPVATAAQLMELALSTVIGPMEEVSVALRHHFNQSMLCGCEDEKMIFGAHENHSTGERGSLLRDELAAHLFFNGHGTSWACPEAPVALLVRRGVPSFPAPKYRKLQRMVQTLASLLSHQRAVCMRVASEGVDSLKRSSLEEWTGLVYDARSACRSRCWCLLQHAIEDFNGAVEYRLTTWLNWREQCLRGDENGASSRQFGTSSNTPRGKANEGTALGKEVVHSFPSLRAMWRHVHASAALEPLFNIVSVAFSDRLSRSAMSELETGGPAEGGSTPSFRKGPRRCPLAACGSKASVEETARERSCPAMSGVCCESSSNVNNNIDNVSIITSKGEERREGMLCYADDIRLSFLYMKSIYKAVFA
ncbi:SPRY domain [Trypanosoma vivax]|nr:SPRY domain [Trypanosoma vivax]